MLSVLILREQRTVAGFAGSVSFTTAGSGNWVVPPGVWRISVVCVGAGGNGINATLSSGGGGGGLCYKNNIPVIPGQIIPYSVCGISGGGGPSSTTFLTMTANRGANGSTLSTAAGGTSSGGDANFTGGSSTTGLAGNGGSTATYTSNGAQNGQTGIGLTGTGSTGTYGRGGNSVLIAPTNGVNGAIRIIWGPNNTYPDNAA